MVERLAAIALHGGRLVWEQCSAEAETPAARRIHLGLDGQASRVYILQSRKHINAVMHPPPLQIHPTTVFAISTSVPADTGYMAGTGTVESSEQFQLLLYLYATFFKTQETCLRLSLMQQFKETSIQKTLCMRDVQENKVPTHRNV